MYYVIEWWNNLTCPAFVTDTDGNTMTFDSKEEAELIANECQYGEVIKHN